MGTRLSTALIYLMINIKEKSPEWSASLADNVHLYEKFPVYRRDFAVLGGGNNWITALDLSLNVENLVAKFGPSSKIGQSEIRPLPVQVLADRKSCVFVEMPSDNLAKGEHTLAFGNVFKFSDCLVLRSECSSNDPSCFRR
jgi:hypothetical protein